MKGIRTAMCGWAYVGPAAQAANRAYVEATWTWWRLDGRRMCRHPNVLLSRVASTCAGRRASSWRPRLGQLRRVHVRGEAGAMADDASARLESRPRARGSGLARERE